MNATSLPTVMIEAPAFAALHRQMHEALLIQNPEWILPNGESPKCDEYDRRFAELLGPSFEPELEHAC